MDGESIELLLPASFRAVRVPRSISAGEVALVEAWVWALEAACLC